MNKPKAEILRCADQTFDRVTTDARDADGRVIFANRVNSGTGLRAKDMIARADRNAEKRARKSEAIITKMKPTVARP